MEKITVLAPAKVNLALEVCGLLPGGYHALDMVMQAVTLYETVTVEKRPSGIQLACRAQGGALAADVPADSRNLAWRAAQLFLQATGIRGGAALEIVKATPSQAGMAGGSADAAGVLFALDRLYRTGLSLPQLCALGAQLGSDVPFCLVGGTAHVQGRGERVQPLPPLPDCWLTAVMPHTGSSTPEGFARYDRMGSPLHPDVQAMVRALQRQSLAWVCAQAGNALQAACATAETQEIVQALRAAGADAALLTGTGAVTYGIFTQEEAAKAAGLSLRRRFEPVFVLRPERRGPFVKEEG